MALRLSGILCLVCFFALIPLTVYAQSAATARLSPPNSDAFPQVETYLYVLNANGEFVHNLLIEHVRILEDETPVKVTSLSELRPGAQIVVALNPGPSLGVRNSQGVSRYEIIKNALYAWGTNRQGSTIDDLSLQITNGVGISHTSEPLEWLRTLEADQTDARTAEPSLDTLFQAVTLAADPTPRSGMGRAVLFITPPPDAQTISSLENIFSQAIGNEIPIFVWLVASPGDLETQGVQRLTELTVASGGQLFSFTGDENIPDPETYFEPLRSIYHLVYDSQVKNSGEHQIVAQIQIGGALLSTIPQSFEIAIQPPNPTFVSPPIDISREPIQESQTGESDTPTEYIPKQQLVEVIYDFPDERIRPITYSALYVDGEIIHENLEPPFDEFSWDLDEYVTDGTHLLQVKAKDSLGLEGVSTEISVSVNVEQATESPWIGIQQNIPLLAGLIALVAGAILVLVLVLGGRITPRAPGAYRRRRRRADPVTQSITHKGSSQRRLPAWANPLQWAQHDSPPRAYAFLTRISDTDNLSIEPPIPITKNKVRIGVDPNQANIVLNHPSIENLHSIIERMDDGSFRLADEGSVAGTWINYAPVSTEGCTLEHGDLIHIGRLGFRFTIREPKKVRKLVVKLASSPEEEIDDPASK